jgi:hypothetical protein
VRPHALLFLEQRALVVRSAAAVAAEASQPTIPLSSTVTSAPERASHQPALRPETPPPTITTFIFAALPAIFAMVSCGVSLGVGIPT